MITRDQVIPLLVESCPLTVARLSPDELDPELLYLTASAFVRALPTGFGEGEEVAAAFAFIERLHIEGDDFVQELATIGFLESLWTPEEPAAIATCERLLGPESLRWWRGLLAFWDGRAPAVLPVDG